MILPDRVLGSSGTMRMRLGLAIGPISLATWLRSSSTIPVLSSSAWLAPARRMTNATTACPVISSLAPTTADSATFG